MGPPNRAFELKRLRYPAFQNNLQHQLKATNSEGENRGKAGFERQVDVREEDLLRRAKLTAWSKGLFPPSAKRPAVSFSPVHARALALRLKRGTGSLPPQTFASSAYMRRFRLRFVGAVLKLIRDNPSAKVRLVTIIPRDWRIPGRSLPRIKPKQLLERFRQQLVRAGLKNADGWLIAFMHGDYDPTKDAYQLHLHVIASDDLVLLIEKLRDLPAYRPGESSQPGYVRQPIRVLRMKNVERRVSYYLAQAFWPSKPSYLKDGVWRRHSRRQRIPDPRLAEWLMWIDRQSFGDFLMLRGCRIGGGALVPQGHADSGVPT